MNLLKLKEKSTILLKQEKIKAFYDYLNPNFASNCHDGGEISKKNNTQSDTHNTTLAKQVHHSNLVARVPRVPQHERFTDVTAFNNT